ncbi:vacuolar protein sorting-associated protein 51 homolog [Pollicipes pollicipes]|uniref:vacuolar protein sorting-associated protein 51 homolog n=1 Tax=Pollicipes pollicipes TaxID=41117 RepID=UPI0018854FF5|nr:vacuolar protein sorting-associated protein 51 homolog [Pollicipes pollicipes]XP_037092493.1 vacuolar protein sorting-associated protein 51 homolog [Pollicipes pollicipes]XP_037092494.1 vacuolar protein sorting-associated protein 51 homolog [Pollicipes pollicipes]XP_037092495.1 vacuolar protein sorting-associated protein 51 homolog [Pollicipes pollicipes]XP_037092496.1 vacuolar protein sorting-associated protein 51 homolog [Pollicipes pollicipes]XP_037092497.1 vacuolar protein sorting-assoc
MSENELAKKPNNAALREFYQVKTSREMSENDLYDLNSPHFNPDMYLHQLLRESSLTELMDTEANVYKQIQSLDSDMQTLVYENYNKFISATDTIRKMKVDFKKMEDEMELLAENMKHITAFSGTVSDTLQDRRDEMNKLASTHVMLKKLQFLFELPSQLRDAIQKENYRQAVEYYLQSQRVLDQYEPAPDTPSLHGLRAESADSIVQLVQALHQRLQDDQASTEQLSEAVQLLLQLEQPADALCQRVIAHAQSRLVADLAQLTGQLELLRVAGRGDPPADAKLPMDILEFVDVGCSTFLSNLSLFVTSYRDLFMSQEDSWPAAADRLSEFVSAQVSALLAVADARLQLEEADSSPAVMARALDRLYRRLQGSATLLPDGDHFVSAGMQLIWTAVERKCRQSLSLLEAHLQQCVDAVRQALVVSAPAPGGPEPAPLAHQLTTFVGSLAERVRTLVAALQAFIQPELSFASLAGRRQLFCRQHVREGVLVGFFRHFVSSCAAFCQAAGDKASPNVVLLLSRACRDLETSTVHYLMDYVDDVLHIDDKTGLTPATSLNQDIHDVGQQLINHYVRVQGLAVSQMLRKSVSTRDWQHAGEPRSVRSVMKRVVEELAAVDAQVGTLYEDAGRWDQHNSSDSSRRTLHGAGRQQRHEWSSYAPSQADSGLVANIQKLFSERIEIFAPVEFSKASILTGIIKISLKTLLECVRLKTFNKFGLQQIQVDVYYLQVNLWRFVADDKLLHGLLDEVLGSAIHRCLEPVLMEFSVIEALCDRG